MKTMTREMNATEVAAIIRQACDTMLTGSAANSLFGQIAEVLGEMEAYDADRGLTRSERAICNAQLAQEFYALDK